MPAPKLPATISLQTVRDDLVFTEARLSADKNAKDLAAPLRKVIGKWTAVNTTQLECWDAQTRADALVTAADDDIDDFVDRLSAAVLPLVNNDRSAPLYTLYFAMSPSELKRPVLGAELELVRAWEAHLKKQTEKALKAFAVELPGLLKAADDAIKARRDADTENASFRKTGDLATFLVDVENARDELFVALDGRRSEKGRPRAWPANFYRKRQPAKVTEEDKAAKAQKAAAAKAKRDAVAEAKAKVKEAEKALRALSKPAKK